MKRRKVLHVVGARPNFMKIAPVMAALATAAPAEPGAAETSGAADGSRVAVDQVLVHTGQHCDERLSHVFFDELGLDEPDHFLGVGSGTHAELTANVLVAIEKVLEEERPDLVVVPGDINSTLAAALAAIKLGYPVAHIEAGLRSFDRGMPEEVNRILVDHISELLFTTCRDANANLAAEGIPEDKVRFVGNPMIDTLDRMRPVAAEQGDALLQELGVAGQPFVLATVHRAANVDEPGQLARVMRALETISRQAPVVFPVHKRTRARLEAAGLAPAAHTDDPLVHTGNVSAAVAEGGLRLVEPFGYIDFLALMDVAALVVTDSGGVQEETTVLGTPCLTVRESTERPVTVEHGTNRLVDPRDEEAIVGAALAALAAGDGTPTTGDGAAGGVKALARRPQLWDGRAGERIAAEIVAFLAAR